MVSTRARAVLAVLSLCSASLGAPLAAQVEHGGVPPSMRRLLREAPPTARMRRVDHLALRAEDAAQAAGLPPRFGEMLEVDLGLRNAGRWEELGGGDRVWRLRIESPGAYSLALVFSRFQLTEGAELYVHDEHQSSVRGAYTELENRLDGKFAVRPLRGQALTLEYFEPARARGRGELQLAFVVHDYVDVLSQLEDKDGGGGSGACETDVACPEGAAWQDQIRAVGHILLLPSGRMCTGSLVNNTANDGTALFISAEHCGDLSTSVFTFNFQRPGCSSGAAPMTDTIVGAVELVVDEALDFRLVRLQGSLPASYNAFCAGWDRTDVAPTNTATIHHPGGDPKKISLDNNPPGKMGTTWQIFQWDVGVTEGGSSGAPLYSAQGHFIGQLSAGSSNCLFPNGDDFFGRLASQWDMVEPYLDPVGTGQATLGGIDPASVTPLPFDVTGLYPPQVETLHPGTEKPVRILGAGFTDATTVAVDGVPLAATAFVRGGNTWINVDPPLLAIGPHQLTVTEGSLSETVNFDVVAPAGPRFQCMDGNPGDPVFSVTGVDLVYADQPGHVHYCYWSTSNIPSVHPLLTLGLGNQFTQIMRCGFIVIPPQGYVQVHLGVSPSILPMDTPVYSQSACLTHGLPLPASNLQGSLFMF